VLSEELLKPLAMSVNALAIALRVPATRMGAIVKGERAVTADTALRRRVQSPEFVQQEVSAVATHALLPEYDWRADLTAPVDMFA
jgi:hypothetical protein